MRINVSVYEVKCGLFVLLITQVTTLAQSTVVFNYYFWDTDLT